MGAADLRLDEEQVRAGLGRDSAWCQAEPGVVATAAIPPCALMRVMSAVISSSRTGCCVGLGQDCGGRLAGSAAPATRSMIGPASS